MAGDSRAAIPADYDCDGQVDLYNPNVIRASLGALFTVPAFALSSDDALAWLTKNKIHMVATSPDAPVDYSQADYTGAVCIALGSENLGLSASWLRQAKKSVRIPMQGRMDSLNVSCSAAVLLYEALRQRQEKT